MNISFKNNKIYFGLFTILTLYMFTAYMFYIYEPIGDDVLFYFDRGLTLYLDDFENEVGNRITTLSQVFEFFRFSYFYWSGRFCSLTHIIGKILPLYLQACITAIIYITNIFLSLRLVFKSSKRVLQNSLFFILLFLALYWSKPAVYYSYMWIIVSIYGFGLMFYLLYMNLIKKNENKPKNVFMPLNLLLVGFIAGWCHEVDSLCLITIICCNWFLDTIINKEKWTKIFNHTGLFIGYLIGVFAPGNFYRMHQSHDIITTSFLERLHNSIYVHSWVLKDGSETKTIYFIISALALTSLISLIIKKDKNTLLNFIKENISYMIMIFISIILWAKAPRIPEYGLDFFLAISYIILLNLICSSQWLISFIEKTKVQIISVTFLIIFLITCYYPEVSAFAKVAKERKVLIENAVKEHKKEVTVPMYPEKISNKRFILEYLNSQKEYDSTYYIKYFGTHVIINNNSK